MNHSRAPDLVQAVLLPELRVSNKHQSEGDTQDKLVEFRAFSGERE